MAPGGGVNCRTGAPGTPPVGTVYCTRVYLQGGEATAYMIRATGGKKSK